MAKIGLRYGRYNTHGTNGKFSTLTGSAPPSIGKLIDAKFDEEKYSAELYAEDTLAESDYGFKKGKVTLGIEDMPNATNIAIFGKTLTDGTTYESADDSAPEVGYVQIVPMIRNHVKSYRVEFLPRVKFEKFTEESKTKGESLEFLTGTLEGTVYALDSEFNGIPAGTYRMWKDFSVSSDTTLEEALEDAIKYANTLLTPETSTPQQGG